MAIQTPPTDNTNDSNEAVYVKDGFMTWEVFRQILLLLSIPLASSLLAFLLVLLVTPQLTAPERMIPHHRYNYVTGVEKCERLWQQQSLDEFEQCVQTITQQVKRLTFEYKTNFLDLSLLQQLSQKLELDKPEVEINNSTNNPEIPTNRSQTPVVPEDNMAHIHELTNIDTILAYCRGNSGSLLGYGQIENVECYKRILELEPTHHEALRAINAIKNRYIRQAMTALNEAESGQRVEASLQRAWQNINNIKIIEADNPILTNLLSRYREKLTDHCYDIIDLAFNRNRILDDEREFILNTCPQEVQNELSFIGQN
jgi:hypothetical protein